MLFCSTVALLVATHVAAGQWVFDGAAGVPLSADMANSAGGYTLIRAGADRGLLVAPDGQAAAVLRAAAARGHELDWGSAPPPPTLAAALAAASAAKDSRHAPCPKNGGDSAACLAWCRAVAPSAVPIRGVVGAEDSCSQNGLGANCSCVDKRLGTLWASCRESCGGATASGGAKASGSAPAPAKAAAAAPVPKLDTAPQPPKSPTRYLLYDTNFGESFGAQTEVFLSAVKLVAELNTKVGKGDPWTLVLPPWCTVLHWYSESSHLPWRELFDMAALRSVPAIEYEDFRRHVGSSAAVETAVVPALGNRGQGGRGDFAGWDQKAEACSSGDQKMPQKWKRSRDQTSVVYGGYCDDDIAVSELRCGVLQSPSTKALVDMIGALPTNPRSVLVKHLDALPLPLPAPGQQPALQPARALEEAADAFATRSFGGLPYIAVHLRRNEFVRNHPETTPAAEAAAARINKLLKDKGVDQVFVATDGRRDFLSVLRKRVRVPVYTFMVDDGAQMPDHKGKEDVINLRLLAKAKYFVGSQASSFSALVRRERQRLGLSSKSSEEGFCRGLSESEAGVRCTAK